MTSPSDITSLLRPGAVVPVDAETTQRLVNALRFTLEESKMLAGELYAKLNGEYMVSVENAGAPSKVHKSCPEAMVEAERLAKQQRGRVVRVLQVVRTLEPCHRWRDFPGDAF